jgi:hypothetical protein
VETSAWQCPNCRHALEPQFDECWDCGYVRGSGGDETLREPTPGSDPITCVTCMLGLDFIGTKQFHVGPRGPFVLGEMGEFLIDRDRFDVYECPRCGRIELFMDGVGEEFRDH